MEKYRSFLRSQFLKDGITLISGNVWAQIIAFLAYFLLTRLYSPEEFGLYNIFFSYIEVLIILSTCKYEMAIVLGDNEREAMAVSKLAFRLNLVVSLTLLLIITILSLLSPFPEGSRFAIFSFHNISVLVAFLIPVMVYLCGTSRIYATFLNRLRQFKQIAISEVVSSSSGMLLRILFGLPRPVTAALHSLGLPLGVVLGRLVGNINLRIQFNKIDKPRDIGWCEQKAVAAKYRNFPLFTMPKELMNSISFNLPFLWLALYFNHAEVGLFSLALTCTSRPVNVLNSAFEKLLYVRITDKVRERLTIKGDLLHFVKMLNVAALPLFVLAFIFSDTLFSVLFGGRWSGCGYYLRCLLPWMFVSLTTTSLIFLTNVFSKQRTEFLFFLILFLFRVAAILVGLHTMDFRLAILLFSIAGAAVSLALLLWLARLVNRYEKELRAA